MLHACILGGIQKGIARYKHHNLTGRAGNIGDMVSRKKTYPLFSFVRFSGSLIALWISTEKDLDLKKYK